MNIDHLHSLELLDDCSGRKAGGFEPGSLSTLRAVVTFDYARLAYGWWLAFTVPARWQGGFLQMVSITDYLR